jgi:hypothetical protein
LGEFLDRRLGDDVEEQRRQGDIDQEEIQPREPGTGNPGDLSGQETEEDHAEERQGQRKNVKHAN